jgi:NhaP-type Na+/H+ or K+/H+ antiporter
MAGYLVLVGFIALYALAAARLEYFWITGPIIFVVLGFFLGTRELSVVELGLDSEIVRVVTELTLALLLFSDASTVNPRALRKDASLIGLLLFIGVPLAVAIGTVAGWLILPAVSLGVYALLASILAPTDLSLGLALFKNPRVPARVRRELNVESGLNDGIATPFVTLFIGVSVAETAGSGHVVVQAITDIVIGMAIGIAVGGLGALLMRLSTRYRWSSALSRQFAALALGLLAYGAALALEGNGFIAAFVAGITFGAIEPEAGDAVEFTEKTGTLLTFAVWFIFGATVAPILIADGVHWRPIVYALVSLAVVRMLAVFISSVGKGLHRSTVLFVGWFGPRGLASVVFLILALQSLGEEGVALAQFAEAAGWTILFSVVLHGLSAVPVARWYGSRAARFGAGSQELEPVTALKARRGLAGPSSYPAD